jgi:ubiquinone/menaquinone biosynthesis C-methylase UbiE
MTSTNKQHGLVQERFTRTAAEFASFSRAVRAAEAAQLLEMTRAHTGAAALQGMQALDVACGGGTFTLVFAPPVRHITGLDITPAILENARSAAAAQGIANVAWLLGNAEALPWPGASFDLVTTAYSLHHMVAAHQAVAEMARVLKPGGWLALVDVAVPDGFDTQINNAIEIARDASHGRSFFGAELHALVENAGLRVAEGKPGARQRSFDDWMRIAGWPRGHAAYAETRRLMEQNIPHDRSGFAPRRTGDAPEADLAWTQTSFFLIAHRPV